jgi:hypothetical protein
MVTFRAKKRRDNRHTNPDFVNIISSSIDPVIKAPSGHIAAFVGAGSNACARPERELHDRRISLILK